MKLTLGDMIIIADTLQQSINIVNFSNITSGARKELLERIIRDETIVVEGGEEKP